MIQNPVLPGFCPDPSIVRVGDDYYLATSTFNWFPGVRLFHTRDLVHYEQLPSPLSRVSQLDMQGEPNSCGVWAPDLSFDGERFWLVYTDVKARCNAEYYNTHNYAVWTTDLQGEWSEPVYLNSTGFDPSLFHDSDGHSYLVTMINGFKGIMVQEFDLVSGQLIGPSRNVCTGCGLGFTEGPHLYHIGPWYYLMMAEGGTAYEHCEVICRAKSLWGPYEENPDNPVLTSDRQDPQALQKCGHADLVQTSAGEWYLVHLCARPNGRGQSILGRETAIQKVSWNADGWLELASGGRYGQREVPEPAALTSYEYPRLPELDEFSGSELGIQYSTLRVPAEQVLSLKARPGWLRLYGFDFLNSCFQVGLLARRQTAKKTVMKCGLSYVPLSARAGAGIAYLYDSANFFLLVKTLNDEGELCLALLQSDGGEITLLKRVYKIPLEGMLHLRVATDEDSENASFSWSVDGNIWQQVGRVKTDILSDEHCVGFMGAHFGLYCYDLEKRNGFADFKYFFQGDKDE